MFDREYSFRGKHAQFVRELADGKTKLFDRYIDVYILAPIIGLLYGRQAEPDEMELTAKIFAEQLVRESIRLTFIYRLTMMVDTSSPELTSDQKLQRAFRDDGNEDSLQRNMALFDSYVLGGVELLYEKLVQGKTEPEDCIDSLYEFVAEFTEHLQDKKDPLDVAEVLVKYGS